MNQRFWFCILLLCGFSTNIFCADVKSLQADVRRARQVFGIKEGAFVSNTDLKTMYRQKAKEWHPDRSSESREKAEQLFKDLGWAYSVLSKPYYDNIEISQEIEDITKIRSFSPSFVKTTIGLLNAELRGRTWATQHITPPMRLCCNWLKLMVFARTNNWREVAELVQTNPQLVHLHDGQADALSLAISAYNAEDTPACMKKGMLLVQQVLKDHGAKAGFPAYDGGFIGAGKYDYWY